MARKTIDLIQFGKESERNFPSNREFLLQLKKTKPKQMDDFFHRQHEETFAQLDCLECANCCKTTSPIFYTPDIQRAAKALKMKSSDFIGEYLHIDDEGDYVLKSAPCPFLGIDNCCIIYENRPKACREYPHTNRKRMHQILKLTLNNTKVCPATLEIVNRLREKM